MMEIQNGKINILRGVKFNVGRILETKSDKTVLTDVHISTDASGLYTSSTTQDIRVSHNTWMLDLVTNREYNYAGNGELKARAGHVLGTMTWHGRSLMDVNFTTGNTHTIDPPSTNPIISFVFALMMLSFGWALFPLMALMSPLAWLSSNGRFGALYLKNPLPDIQHLEAILTFVGGAIYLDSFYYLFNYLQPVSLDVFSLTAGLVFIVIFALHQYVMRACKSKHSDIMDVGSAQLAKIFSQVEQK